MRYQVRTESGSGCVQPICGLQFTALGSRQLLAITSEIGKPFSAYSMAGCRTSLKVMVPNLRSASSQPQAALGTGADRIPYTGMPDP